jgi:hypothetical protein
MNVYQCFCFIYKSCTEEGICFSAFKIKKFISKSCTS